MPPPAFLKRLRVRPPMLGDPLSVMKVWLMASGMLLEFGVQYQALCSGKFAWLVNHASVANRMDVSVEVAKARCQVCFSKPGFVFSPFERRSPHKGSCLKIIYNFGTANYQMPSSKLVLNGDCIVQKREVAKLSNHQLSQEEPGWFCVREDLAFLIVDLAFHVGHLSSSTPETIPW